MLIAAEHDRFPDGIGKIDAGGLAHHRNFSGDIPPFHPAQILPVQPDFAPGGNQAGHRLEQGGFAAAVRPENAEILSGRHRKGNVVQYVGAVIAGAQTGYFQHTHTRFLFLK